MNMSKNAGLTTIIILLTIMGGFQVETVLSNSSEYNLKFPMSVSSGSDWNKTYDGGGNDLAHALVATSDGGFVIVGESDADTWVIKTDANGNKEWDEYYEGLGSVKAHDVVQSSDGFVMAGYYYRYQDDRHGLLIKIDSNGNEEWMKTYDGEFDDEFRSLIRTSDGGFALAGYTGYSFPSGEDSDFWLLKVDANGKEEWNQTYGGVEEDKANAVVQTADGGFALAGITDSLGAGGYDWWMVKTDANGNEEWNQTYGGEEWDMANALIRTPDGGFALAGYSKSTSAGEADFWLVKTDANGNEEWNKNYGGIEDDEANALIRTKDGGFALAGETVSYGDGRNFWLVKTDKNGDTEGSKVFEEGSVAEALVQVADGSYVFVGWVMPYTGPRNYMLVKISSLDEPRTEATYGLGIISFLIVLVVLVQPRKKIKLDNHE